MSSADGRTWLAAIVAGGATLAALAVGCGSADTIGHSGAGGVAGGGSGTGGATQSGLGGITAAGSGGTSGEGGRGFGGASVGPGGSTGTGGSGRAGAPGFGGASTGGAPGVGGASSGAGGATGRGGSGVGGSSGQGGASSGVGGRSSGTGGRSSGTGGASSFACLSPVAAPSLLTDFSPVTWMNTSGKWGTAGFTGSKYSYASPATGDAGMSTASATVDVAPTAQNLNFVATVPAGGFAGFGLLFDQCATVAAYDTVQFVLTGTTGGCDLELQLQTFDQRPNDQSPPGGCDRKGGATCFNYPMVTGLPAPPTATDVITVSVPFSSLSVWNDTLAKEIVAVQWQLTAPGTAACDANLRVDDIRFVTQ